MGSVALISWNNFSAIGCPPPKKTLGGVAPRLLTLLRLRTRLLRRPLLRSGHRLRLALVHHQRRVLAVAPKRRPAALIRQGVFRRNSKPQRRRAVGNHRHFARPDNVP